MIEDITAPAPRLILRLLCLRKLLAKHINSYSSVEVACEIGPGLGDAASFMMREKYVKSWHLYEGSESAYNLLENRFASDSNITLKKQFKHSSAATDKYGLVLCCEVIEHVDDDELFIKSIASSIEVGGLFFGSVPAYTSKWQSVDELAGHYRRYEREELSHKLEAAGFEVLRMSCYGFPLINLLYPLREFYYRQQLAKNRNSTKAEATARSGIARGLANKFDKRWVYLVICGFSFFQSLPVISSLGDGFVFVARKRS